MTTDANRTLTVNLEQVDMFLLPSASATVTATEAIHADRDDDALLSEPLSLHIPPKQVLRTTGIRVDVSLLPRARPQMWFPSPDELGEGNLQ